MRDVSDLWEIDGGWFWNKIHKLFFFFLRLGSVNQKVISLVMNLVKIFLQMFHKQMISTPFSLDWPTSNPLNPNSQANMKHILFSNLTFQSLDLIFSIPTLWN